MKRMLQVRETEVIRKYSCNSYCKSSCRIFHEKHNWVRPVSDALIQKLNSLKMYELYICGFCEKSFEGLTELKAHVEIIHAAERCEQSLERIKEPENHLHTSHSLDLSSVKKLNGEKNRCEQCGQLFHNCTDLENHLSSFHSIAHSDNILEITRTLEQHLQNTHSHSTEEKPVDDVLPGTADSEFNSIEESFGDISSNSGDPVPKQLCNICLLSFQNEEKLKEHMTKHVNNGRLSSILKK